MNTPDDDTMSIAERAAWWLEALKECSVDERRAFLSWLRESPLHVRQFMLISALDVVLDDLDVDRRYDIDHLVRIDATRTSGIRSEAGSRERVIDEESSEPSCARSVARPWVRRWAMVAAATLGIVAILFGGISVWDTSHGWQSYTTAVGEQRTVELDDGSAMVVNTRSHVEVRFSKHEREARLLDGEVMFSVARDAARPFRVLVDESVVQAIGTQFDAYRERKGRAMIAVLEGAVEISQRSSKEAATTVTAGQRATITAGQPVAVDTVNVQLLTNWPSGRLLFTGETLGQIVAQVNRYNRMQISIEDEAIREVRVAGAFNPEDPQALLNFLVRRYGFDIQIDGNRAVVRPHPAVAPATSGEQQPTNR